MLPVIEPPTAPALAAADVEDGALTVVVDDGTDGGCGWC